MSASAMLAHLVLERCSGRVLDRIPEPEMAMCDAAENAAFRDAGRDSGVLAFLYFFHALRITSVIAPGYRVLDLSCGPANQLTLAARLNPDVQFLGIDASPAMLDEGWRTLAHHGVRNVQLAAGDMTELSEFADASVDAVISTMSLHHLPDLAALHKTMRQARRVLRPCGAVYLVDFGRLKRRSTQRYFAQDWREEQSAAFTEGYLHSLQAAFSVDELTQAVETLGMEIARFVTPLAPFMVVFTSPPRQDWTIETRTLAMALYGKLGSDQQHKLWAFARWLGMGGCTLPFPLY